MQRKQSFIVVTFLFITLFSQGQQLNIATYNLRYDNKGDSGNLWVNRAPVIAALVQFHDFDVFGTQEGLQNQLEDLQHALPGYAQYGIGRDDGRDKGEHSAIFYKTGKFTLLKSGDFWLSPTPEKPGPGWDAHLNRICSWVQLQEIKTKKKFCVFNAHYDHQGMQARRESSKLVLAKIKEIAGNDPALFTGDLNGGHESEWYEVLANSDGQLKDTYNEAPHPYATGGSFNGFGATLGRNDIIDHIFITRHFTAQKWGILTDSYHGKYPSDHFPVMALINFK